MIRKSFVMMSLATLSLVGFSSPSHARPVECRSGEGRKIYSQSFQNRMKDLTRAWTINYNNDCQKQDMFEKVFGSQVDASGPLFRLCKNAGRNEATTKVFAEIEKRCYNQGAMMGAQDGYAYAWEYCEFTYGTKNDFQTGYNETCIDVFTRFVSDLCPEKIEEKDGDFDAFFARVESECAVK
jgi:hypothetical protein